MHIFSFNKYYGLNIGTNAHYKNYYLGIVYFSHTHRKIKPYFFTLFEKYLV